VKFYVTTPIYYVNDAPTVGSASTTIMCDVLARYHRSRGDDVLLTTGTDEHALKVLRVAEQQGIAPKAYVDRMASIYREEWRRLNISYDDFIQTSEPRHHRAVQAFMEALYRNGDLYQGAYEGWYCVSDETFFAEAELVQGHCPNPECGKPVEWVSEPAYFFRFSKYGDRLLRRIEETPNWLIPEFRKNEVVSFIRGGLRDVCVTRRGTWGIPLPPSIPNSDGLVVYVWADALINYVTCAGYPHDMARFQRLWPADVHVMAKEIFTRFHATFWPAALLSLGMEPPKQVAAHGYWTVGGKKISKSAGGKMPRPEPVLQEIVKETGCSEQRAVDALRYYMLREIPFGPDGEFSVEALLRRYQDDLGNDLGNLLHRVLTMIGKYRKGVLPQPSPPEPELAEAAKTAVEGWESALKTLQFSDGLKAIWVFLATANRYVDHQAPWSLAKTGDQEALDRVLYSAAEAIRIAAVLIAPTMPDTAGDIEKQLGLVGWERKWDQATQWGLLPQGLRISEPSPLFPRVETRPPAAPKTGEKPMEKQPEKALVSIKEFQRIDLRIGEVLTAESVPGADKLLKLTVDIGGEVRTMVAGIALSYRPEELPGKRVVVVANLEPATIRGVRSEGMVLAGWVKGEDQSITLVSPERPLPKGSKVT